MTEQPEVGSIEVDNSGVTAPSQDDIGLMETVGAPKTTYDWPLVEKFIDKVFHTLSTGHRLVYTAKTNIPSRPLSGVDKLKKSLTRTTAPRSLFYCASSCTPDAKGILTHSKDLFQALHVVVLDDIGTKIPVDSLPELFKQPSYIIESSPNNFQYGLILKEPLTNYQAAQRLIQTLALAGLTDKGGAMPCKLVRLPDGVNGKDDPIKRFSPVTLIDETDKLFTPDEILTAAAYTVNGTVVTWDDIKNEKINPMSLRYNTKYLPKQPVAQSTTGEIDDVLEWLYERNLVVADSGDGWVEIICPNCQSHSDPSANTAGYWPLGRGQDARGFNCFHDSCSTNKTDWFLMWVINNSPFQILAKAQTGYMAHGEYAYCQKDGDVYSIISGESNPLAFVKNARLNQIAFTINGQGKIASMSVVDMWLRSPNLIVISGSSLDVEHSDRILSGAHDSKRLNTYVPVPWGEGPYDQAEVDIILDYIKFLLPAQNEYDFFMEWLAAKIQNPAFRGCAIVMSTPVQGIGRSTLGKMIRTMLGMQYTKKIKFADLTRDQPFNEWADRIFIMLDEVEQTSPAHAKRAYNRLKEEIDTSSDYVSMNVKNQAVIEIKPVSSYLILTNQPNGIVLDRNDRRMAVFTNPEVPRSKTWYVDFATKHLTRLDADGLETWARHFYRYLMTLTPNLANLSRAPMTTAKREAIATGMSYTERACIAVEKYFLDQDICFANFGVIDQIVSQALATHEVEAKTYAVSREFDKFSRPFAKTKKISQKLSRVRIFTKCALAAGYDSKMLTENRVKKWSDIPSSLNADVMDDIDRLDTAALLSFVTDELL